MTTDTGGVDSELLSKLEEALASVQSFNRAWRAGAERGRYTDDENTTIREARQSIMNRIGPLKQDVRQLTGRQFLDLNGRLVDVWDAAFGPNAMEASVGPGMRIPYIQTLEDTVREAVTLVREGATVRALRGPEAGVQKGAPTNPHERARDELLKAIVEHTQGDTPTIEGRELARLVGRPLTDVEHDLDVLREDRLILVAGTLNSTGSSVVQLTTRGRQRAKEGAGAVQPSPQIVQSQTFLVSGGSNTFAQTGTGDVFQTVQQPSDVAEIRRLLDELKDSITALDVPVEEREEYLVLAEQVRAELDRPQLRQSMLKIPWRHLERIAALEGARQGGALVLDIVGRLGPYINALLQAAPPSAPMA